MPETENDYSWRMWDEQLAVTQIQHVLTTLKCKGADNDEDCLKGNTDREVTVVDQKPSHAEQCCIRVELVNVDLDANALTHLVNVMVELSILHSLLVVCLDDNALGEDAAPNLCRLLLGAPKLRASRPK
ncbi:hypothetical protein Esti_002278 [Eimeria stiedai]